MLNPWDNNIVIAGCIRDGSNVQLMNVNAGFVQCKVKQNLNTDITTEDDKIIPKYGERIFITTDIVKNKWFGKNVNCLGDSVTKGEDSANSYLRMKDDNIASILREEFGFFVSRNYGVGGSRISGTSGSAMCIRYSDMTNDADLIIVWGGTNDFGAGVSLGSLSDTSGTTNFIPAYYNLLNGLQNKYPGKQILAITPMHRKDTMPDNLPNGAGLFLKDYRNAVISVCEQMSVPYLDMWTELGFTPFNTTMKNAYMPDGLHPSIAGMRTYVGRKICDRVRNL
jgi:lysophospholipase L1-like esterase